MQEAVLVHEPQALGEIESQHGDLGGGERVVLRPASAQGEAEDAFHDEEDPRRRRAPGAGVDAG